MIKIILWIILQQNVKWFHEQSRDKIAVYQN